MITAISNRYGMVSSARVAEILRSARNLMNNGGKHWIKGEEKLNLAEIVVQPDHSWNYLDDWDESKFDKNEYAFCAIGAIKEVAIDERETCYAYLELVKMIDPDTINDLKEDWRYTWVDNYECPNDDCDWDYRCDIPDAPNPTIHDLVEYALDDIDKLESTITSKNDAKETTWNDVSKWFTTAANRAKARKG